MGPEMEVSQWLSVGSEAEESKTSHLWAGKTENWRSGKADEIGNQCLKATVKTKILSKTGIVLFFSFYYIQATNLWLTPYRSRVGHRPRFVDLHVSHPPAHQSFNLISASYSRQVDASQLVIKSPSILLQNFLCKSIVALKTLLL